MDFTESTKVVYNRIQQLEPENVSKIIGYLLLQDHGEREMIRLAFCPDSLIHSLVNKAKSELGLTILSPSSRPIKPSTLFVDHPTHFNPYLSGPSISSPVNIEFMHHGYPDHVLEEPSVGGLTSCRSPSLPEFPLKVCHYFLKGFCKHGNNCRYFHCRPPPTQESFTQMFSNGYNDDNNVLSPGSLEQLELEITEVLKARRGLPVSIASLPMLYYEKFGKSLQAEGYLTESQRHGKAGYSLTKLLARLSNSIRLIDRPHGQHSVILAEDIPKYLEFIGDRNEPGGIIIGSRQIYLTFPAESTFTEQDVSNYFSKFGPVQDVRIPCQPKRMFGFVTFVFSETVKQILTKGNPHFVCCSRVLVKPYREKSKFVDRKHMDRVQHAMYYGPNFIDGDSELNSAPRVYNNSRSLRIEAHEQDLEFERMRFSEMQLVQESSTSHSFYGYSIDKLNLSDDQAELSSADFPESPFASPLQSSVSAVI